MKRSLAIDMSNVVKETKEDNFFTAPSESASKGALNREDMYILCQMCGKNYKPNNYDAHLEDCERKHKEKKFKINNNLNLNSRQSIENPLMKNLLTSQTRQPMMPPVMYGGRPNFNLKFGNKY